MSDTPLTDRLEFYSRITEGDLKAIEKLERENAALREHHQQDEALIVQRTDEIRHLETENAALRADKERLDWLETQCTTVDYHDDFGLLKEWSVCASDFDCTIRAAIDAARKENG